MLTQIKSSRNILEIDPSSQNERYLSVTVLFFQNKVFNLFSLIKQKFN